MISIRAGVIAVTPVAAAVAVYGHDGPPFPILSDHATGPYVISIWTDPDTTDDGSPGGQFWVRLHARGNGEVIPGATRVMVGIRPAGQPAEERTAAAAPVRGDVTNQFAALVMDHEGRFAVRVAIDGPLGAAAADAAVDATYNVRPPRSMLLLYLAPFLLIGLLWGRLLMRRRRGDSGVMRSPRGQGRKEKAEGRTNGLTPEK